MEMKQEQRVVVAKPVASRPTNSNFRSFSELLDGAINVLPPTTCSETAVAAFRPKTVRFKPNSTHPPTGLFSSQAETSGCTPSNVVYKPQAKLVSKTTVSLLANMGNFNASQAQANVPSHAKAGHIAEKLRNLQEEDPKPLQSMANVDRPSYDGYNWRKYGQKQVKGSEYPRSYYKCTYPNCPVKKKVERSYDGEIAEIVYKGEHSHSKPQPPPKHNSSGTQGQGLVSDSNNGQDENSQLWNGTLLRERNEGSEYRAEDQNGTVLPANSSYYQAKAPPSYEPARTGLVNARAGTFESSCGLTGECDEGNKRLEEHENVRRSKRRKNENHTLEASVSGEGVQEPRVPPPSSADNEIVGDGFRWRKYGQKVVKGNPYPRSYYRCTSLKCNVRKHVERASDDPRAFITTYEGKHNHEIPVKITDNPPTSESNLP